MVESPIIVSEIPVSSFLLVVETDTVSLKALAALSKLPVFLVKSSFAFEVFVPVTIEVSITIKAFFSVEVSARTFHLCFSFTFFLFVGTFQGKESE